MEEEKTLMILHLKQKDKTAATNMPIAFDLNIVLWFEWILVKWCSSVDFLFLVLVVLACFGKKMELLVKDWLYGRGRQREIACGRKKEKSQYEII